eukprot:m.57933 g.57933  ORF g.57933 m.57933 type:complete len:407 (+) comp15629_c0_seq4:121-1341(+)
MGNVCKGHPQADPRLYECQRSIDELAEIIYRSNTAVDTAIEALERKVGLLEERGLQLHNIVLICENLASKKKTSASTERQNSLNKESSQSATPAHCVDADDIVVELPIRRRMKTGRSLRGTESLHLTDDDIASMDATLSNTSLPSDAASSPAIAPTTTPVATVESSSAHAAETMDASSTPVDNAVENTTDLQASTLPSHDAPTAANAASARPHTPPARAGMLSPVVEDSSHDSTQHRPRSSSDPDSTGPTPRCTPGSPLAARMRNRTTSAPEEDPSGQDVFVLDDSASSHRRWSDRSADTRRAHGGKPTGRSLLTKSFHGGDPARSVARVPRIPPVIAADPTLGSPNLPRKSMQSGPAAVSQNSPDASPVTARAHKGSSGVKSTVKAARAKARKAFSRAGSAPDEL